MKINVEKDLANEKSIYRFYQKLLALRKSRELFTYGETEEYDHRNKRVIAYSRIYEGQRVFVAGNFCNKNTKYQLPEWCANASVLFSNYDKFDSDGLTITLRPYQAVVFEEAAAK
jgi:oligo-1,6-glucosidase